MKYFIGADVSKMALDLCVIGGESQTVSRTG